MVKQDHADIGPVKVEIGGGVRLHATPYNVANDKG
jgi:hypothetical protein